MATTVSDDYEITLPKDVCDDLGITPGMKLQVMVKHRTIRLVPVLPLRELVGFVKGLDTSEIRDERDGY